MELEETSWKFQKEQFVSGLNGTSILETTTISIFPPLLIMIRAFILSCLPNHVTVKPFIRFLLDYTLLVLPLSLVVTLFSNNITQLLILVLIGIATTLLVMKNFETKDQNETNACYAVPSFFKSLMWDHVNDNNSYSSNDAKCSGDDFENESSNVVSSKLPFLNSFRAYVNIYSCICILAVDFQVFPRRLAKTETFGTGFMDLGVGAFIMSNALVCRKARKKTTQTASLFYGLNFSALLFEIFSVWPLAVLGALRLASVKFIGYNEHVSEYGVHWNFFFTLVAVKIFASIFASIIDVKYCLLFSTMLAITYQYILSYFNLTSILLNNDRQGILMQNKEGIASSFGFLSLYFAGVYLGSYIFKPRHTLTEWKNAAKLLFFLNILLWCLLLATDIYIQPVSRRLANLSYVVWLLAYTTFLLCLLLVADIIIASYIHQGILSGNSMPDKWLMMQPKDAHIKYLPPSPPLCMLYALNRNQLLYFLLCNLSTGAINAMVDSMKVTDITAVLIICLYNFVVTCVVWKLNVNERTVKFW